MPDLGRDSMMRSVSSRINPSRTALRLMLNSTARSRSEGSLSPGLKPRSRIMCSSLAVCSRPSMISPGRVGELLVGRRLEPALARLVRAPGRDDGRGRALRRRVEGQFELHAIRVVHEKLPKGRAGHEVLAVG